MLDTTVPQHDTPGAVQVGTVPGPTTRIPAPSLDPGLYKLDEEQTAFLKQQTGISDDEDLKQHILQVQAEAYEVYPYPCIRRFGFVMLKISRLPAYNDLLTLGKGRKAVLLDIGCAFGNDVRKAVTDGYPLENVIASDIEPAFWRLGHCLFNSSPDSFPVPFIGGNALDTAFLQPARPVYEPFDTPMPILSEVATLTELRGHVSAIHASSLFHLFDEAKQLALARSLAGLLAPHSGAMIFGSHGSALHKGLELLSLGPQPGEGQLSMFCHSPESWTALWESIFGADKVVVETKLEEINRGSRSVPESTHQLYMLEWSVKRV